MTSDLGLFGAPSGGIVGSRQLIAVQTIELGRLTHHPVPVVPSALVAVSGTGPDRDSNGSGKTTFLASVALLLGDPEWRVGTSGGGDALGLLFDPDLSGDSAGLYDPARVGYVAGVFARTTADARYDELTVWIRISADDSPRLATRWASGVHLVSDRDDAARMWNSLGRECQLGPTAFVEQLYGGTGRCLAYVTSRGNRDTDTSLMQLQARLSPSRIGSELIVLLGLEHLIDGERELRAKLADAQQKLATRITEHEAREHEWAAMLAEIDARDDARGAIAEGKQLWRLRLARRLLDATTEQAGLNIQLDDLSEQKREAETTVRDLEERLAAYPDVTLLDDEVATTDEEAGRAEELFEAANTRHTELRLKLQFLATEIGELTNRAQAAPADVTVDVARQAVVDAAVALEAATRKVGGAEDRVTDQRRALDTVTQHGDVDPETFTALAESGIVATPLTDGIVLDPPTRGEWEPVLAPWRGALVVRSEDRDRAIAVSPPGTVLVLADANEQSLPEGINQAPTGTARFLRTLIDRQETPYTDRLAGVVVVGDFERELCGREAAIARTRLALETEERELRTAMVARQRAARAHDIAADRCARVTAAAELSSARLREAEFAAALAAASRALADARTSKDQTTKALVDVRVRRDTAHGARTRLLDDLDAARQRVSSTENDITTARNSLAKLDIDGWRRAWGGTVEEAGDALADDDRPENSLRRRASDQLVTALVRLGIDPSTGDRAPTSAIAGVIRARGGLDDDVPPANEVRRFDTVAQPLVDWLDDLAEQDSAFREDVDTERRRWDQLIGAARQECETQSELLDRHRDMVEQQIEAALGLVGTRYSELDAAAGGYGAQVRWRSIRPEQPTDLWIWEVTPEWRRGHGAKWLPYTRQANSAMQKQHRTHLVLAALLAAEDPAGRVLIVDEAGNDFGREHLRQVLSAFAYVAETHGVTVIAACQDKVLEEVAALGVARLLLWFERLSDASPLCRPTRVWGFDADGSRVELTRSSMEAGRLL